MSFLIFFYIWSIEFLKVNPIGMVPALVDGDIVLADSFAILMVRPSINFPSSVYDSYTIRMIIHIPSFSILFPNSVFLRAVSGREVSSISIVA